MADGWVMEILLREFAEFGMELADSHTLWLCFGGGFPEPLAAGRIANLAGLALFTSRWPIQLVPRAVLLSHARVLRC